MPGLSVSLRVENVTKIVKGKVIPVTGREGPYGCGTSRLRHVLDNQLTDGGKFVSITRRPAALYPQEDSWY
jgi:hypothetical protein